MRQIKFRVWDKKYNKWKSSATSRKIQNYSRR
jgi:hypothetical protein